MAHESPFKVLSPRGNKLVMSPTDASLNTISTLISSAISTTSTEGLQHILDAFLPLRDEASLTEKSLFVVLCLHPCLSVEQAIQLREHSSDAEVYLCRNPGLPLALLTTPGETSLADLFLEEKHDILMDILRCPMALVGESIRVVNSPTKELAALDSMSPVELRAMIALMLMSRLPELYASLPAFEYLMKLWPDMPDEVALPAKNMVCAQYATMGEGQRGPFLEKLKALGLDPWRNAGFLQKLTEVLQRKGDLSGVPLDGVPCIHAPNILDPLMRAVLVAATRSPWLDVEHEKRPLVVAAIKWGGLRALIEVAQAGGQIDLVSMSKILGVLLVQQAEIAPRPITPEKKKNVAGKSTKRRRKDRGARA